MKIDKGVCVDATQTPFLIVWKEVDCNVFNYGMVQPDG